MKFRKQTPIPKKVYSVYNPFLSGDPDTLATIMASLIPERPNYTPEEELKFENERKEREARYNEQRYGPLPPDTYRILDQGGFCGWTYELEIDNKIIQLEEPGKPNSAFKVHNDGKLALELARGHVACYKGLEAANNAKFVVVFGGNM